MIIINGVCDKRKLDNPWRTPGERKKFSVCTKGPNGKPVLVRFGDPNMEIKRDSPKRRKNFRARHGCDNPGPKWKPKHWSCKTWEKDKTVSQVVNKFVVSTEREMPIMAKQFNREEVLEFLVSNSGAFDESDRATLDKFSDEVLTSFVGNDDDNDDDDDDDLDDVDDDSDEDTEESEERNQEPVSNGNMRKVKNKGYKKNSAMEDEEDMEENMGSGCGSKGKKKMTKNSTSEQDWLESAPPAIRSVVINAMNQERIQKEQLIAKITSNSRNTFTEEYLNTKDLEELTALSALAATSSTPVANYGAAVPMTRNSKKSSPLVIPTLNYKEDFKDQQ